MFTEYKTVPTTYEVWCAIKKAHPDLAVYGSYSAPLGNYFGDTSKGKMFTSYGFKDGDFPIMEAETTWDIDRSNITNRHNEEHKYWLCLPIKDND